MEFDPKLKICYDRVLPRDSHPTNATLHSMREDALLRGTGAPNARAAFHDIDPTAKIPAPHMALISAKTWPDGSTLKCRFLLLLRPARASRNCQPVYRRLKLYAQVS
jgi:hypothetical protein